MENSKPSSGCAAGNFVSSENLTGFLTALAEIENPAFIAAAQAAGRVIRAENGLKVAFGLIEQQKAAFTLKNPIL
jgi:hypothetical protein